MKVLVACEFSGIVRDAFAARGHDAWSCDLLPTERPGQHIQGDVLNALYAGGWDLLIAHPECTYLCNSGVRWLSRPGRWRLMESACAFFRLMLEAPVERIAVENPVMHGHAKRLVGVQQTQVIQPWQFGDSERKATCLWLKNLPPLRPTEIVLPLGNSVHHEPPGPDRKRNRSRTFRGIAQAMAHQWGALSTAKNADEVPV